MYILNNKYQKDVSRAHKYFVTKCSFIKSVTKCLQKLNLTMFTLGKTFKSLYYTFIYVKIIDLN